jgi:hypothetical protein
LNSLDRDIETGLWSISGMPKITETLQEAAHASIPRIAARLEPAEAGWIGGAVATLLTHFYTADLPKAVYAAISADWVACLNAFPAWAIEEARTGWLKAERRKPLPADIVKLCNRAVSKERAAMALCRRIANGPLLAEPPPLSDEERAANRAAVAKMVAELTRSLRNPGQAFGAAGQMDPP